MTYGCCNRRFMYAGKEITQDCFDSIVRGEQAVCILGIFPVVCLSYDINWNNPRDDLFLAAALESTGLLLKQTLIIRDVVANRQYTAIYECR